MFFLNVIIIIIMLRVSDSECTKLTQILLKLESGRCFIDATMECKQLSKYNHIHSSPAAREKKRHRTVG